MSDKKEQIDVDNAEMFQEVHDRVDALIEVLEKKGVLTKEEFDGFYENFMSRKYDIE